MGRRPGPHKQQLAAIDVDRITRGQLTTAAGFDGAIHSHVTALDTQLGFAASARQALVFKELIEFQGAAWGSSDSVSACLHPRRPAFDTSGRCSNLTAGACWPVGYAC